MNQKTKLSDRIALGFTIAAIAVSVGALVGIIFMFLRV